MASSKGLKGKVIERKLKMEQILNLKFSVNESETAGKQVLGSTSAIF